MNTTVSIPDDVLEEAERLVRRTKRSRSRLFTDALMGICCSTHSRENYSGHGRRSRRNRRRKGPVRSLFCEASVSVLRLVVSPRSRFSVRRNGSTACQSNFFKMNTYRSVSKQTTLTTFRMNTYGKYRGVAPRELTETNSQSWIQRFLRRRKSRATLSFASSHCRVLMRHQKK
jgi:hypothetical protein